MNRRQFVSLAAITALAGCTDAGADDPDSTSVDTTDLDPTSGTTTDRERDALPDVSREELADVEGVLDAHRAALDEVSHTLTLTVTAEDTFEDGFEASESRAYYDPKANRLHYLNWWRYPDGDRAGETEIYADGGAAARRTERMDGGYRLETLSAAAARREYTRVRDDVQGLVSMFEYGSLEDTADGYELPVSEVSDAAADSDIEEVGSGTLRIADSGVIQSFTLTDVLEQLDRERYYDVTFEVTGVGETSVSEPGWFSDVSDATTDGESGSGGDGGPGEDVEDGEEGGETIDNATETTDEPNTTEALDDVGDATEVLAGTDSSLVFDPETVTISPGDTVVWTWKSNNHNIRPEDIPAEADWDGHPEIANEGARYAHTFEVEGEYSYICEPHVGMGMEGKIIVE